MTKTKTSIFLAAVILISGFGVFSADNSDNIEKDTIMRTDNNNAYVIFTNPSIENKMSFYDGYQKGITNALDPNYNEVVTFDGIEGRKVYKENYVYMDLDSDFALPGDSEFLVSITYYDFGPDVGYFHLEYNSSDPELEEANRTSKRISVMKTGLVTKWCSTKIYLEDADFTGAMPFGSDLRLVTNAYNAFAKIEITNISAVKRNSNIKMGTVNSIKAEILHKLRLYDGISATEYNPCLENEMTREELIVAMIKALGYEKEALAGGGICPFTDVKKESAPYITHAVRLGILSENSEKLFNSDKKATKRELLTFYLRALGFTEDDLYENAEEYAKNEVLIEGLDLIFNIDEPMTRDNFAGVACNALILENKKIEKVVIIDMIEKNKVTKEEVKATASAELTAQIYKLPSIVKKREMIDPLTGRKFYYMNIDGGKAIRPYVTQQHWRPDGKSFIVGNDKTQAIYEYNTETEELKMLDYCPSGGSADAVITPNDIMFYRNKQDEIWKMDLKTYKKTKVASKPTYGRNLSCIQVTNDGKYLTAYWKEDRSPDDFIDGYNRIRIIPRLDCETGIWNSDTLIHLFNDDLRYPDAGHPIINPVYENLLFFCHEGTTEHIPDRLWIGDYNTGETRNLFLQAELPNGMTGEPSGHEVWSMDGEDMFFVKYTRKENAGQSGLVRISKDGKNREYINGDYTYWHCYPSGDKKWVAADVQMGGARAEVVLVNTQTYESHMLADFWAPSSTHPYQPHPIVSLDGRMVSWQMVDETGMLGTAWMDVSEIIDAAVEGGKTKISDSAEFISYKGAKNEISKTTRNGIECFRIPNGNSMYIDINDELVNDDDTSIKVRITYVDTGRQPLNIRYTKAVRTKHDYANRENNLTRIFRKGTNGLVYHEIELKDANLANAGKYGTDLCISGFYSDVFIKNIEVYK